MFQAIKNQYASIPETPVPMTEERYEKLLKSVDTWRSSDEIVALSEYLKANRHHGIGLVLLDGRPTLHFEPGLDHSDPERFAVAEQAFNMMLAARRDMDQLIDRNLLAIANHPGFDRQKIAGPS